MTPAGEPAFSLRGVSYAYAQGPAALSEVSFEIGRGETVMLLGANGAGKSTLLRLMDVLMAPTAGRICAVGREVSPDILRDAALSRWFRSRVGFVFQDADAQLFSPTVEEELMFGPLHLGLAADQARRRAHELAASFDIERLMDRAPFRLSGGEKRRVALACTLAVNPGVILMDEPTTGLDPKSESWLIDMLHQLAAAGKTIVAATHSLHLAAEVADRAIVLGSGSGLVADGPAGAILDDLELLERANLIHTHAHAHDDDSHAHPHTHAGRHTHGEDGR